MALVDAAGDLGVATGAEDGGGAGVGVDSREVVGRQREAAVGIVDGRRVMQEEGAIGLVKGALGAAEDERAELEPRVDVGEERRQLCSQAAILEVEQARNPSAGGDGLEEAGGGLVGVDAGRREQTDKSVGLDQAQGALDEQRIQVDVAAAQQGVLAGRADQLAEGVGALLGGVVVGQEGVGGGLGKDTLTPTLSHGETFE